MTWRELLPCSPWMWLFYLLHPDSLSILDHHQDRYLGSEASLWPCPTLLGILCWLLSAAKTNGVWECKSGNLSTQFIAQHAVHVKGVHCFIYGCWYCFQVNSLRQRLLRWTKGTRGHRRSVSPTPSRLGVMINNAIRELSEDKGDKCKPRRPRNPRILKLRISFDPSSSSTFSFHQAAKTILSQLPRSAIKLRVLEQQSRITWYESRKGVDGHPWAKPFDHQYEAQGMRGMQVSEGKLAKECREIRAWQSSR